MADKCFICPEQADKLKTFLIDHDQVLGVIGKKLVNDGKYYSYNDIEPYVEEIEKSAQDHCKIEREFRNYYHQNIIELLPRPCSLPQPQDHPYPPPHAPSSSVHDHSKLEPLFCNPEIDSSRTSEYRRFRSLTDEISANPAGIKMGNSEVLGPLMYFIDYYAVIIYFAEFSTPSRAGRTGRKMEKNR